MDELVYSCVALIVSVSFVLFLVFTYNNCKITQYCYEHTSNYIEYKTCREKPIEEINYLIYKEKK